MVPVLLFGHGSIVGVVAAILVRIWDCTENHRTNAREGYDKVGQGMNVPRSG